jgi:hypothetical protein
VEALQETLGGLLLERERLRTRGHLHGLERNRRAIVRIQHALSLALIAHHA